MLAQRRLQRVCAVVGGDNRLPEALEQHQAGPALDAHGQEDPAQEVRNGRIPDLEEMDRNVEQHESETMGAMEALRGD